MTVLLERAEIEFISPLVAIDSGLWRNFEISFAIHDITYIIPCSQKALCADFVFIHSASVTLAPPTFQPRRRTLWAVLDPLFRHENGNGSKNPRTLLRFGWKMTNKSCSHYILDMGSCGHLSFKIGANFSLKCTIWAWKSGQIKKSFRLSSFWVKTDPGKLLLWCTR